MGFLLKKVARGLTRGFHNWSSKRHSFARIAAEDGGSLIMTQDALGHTNPNTIRVYVQRVGIRRDHHSSKITARLKSKKVMSLGCGRSGAAVVTIQKLSACSPKPTVPLEMAFQ